MASTASTLYEEIVPVPRAACFPIELHPPPDFHPERPSTWPRVHGRLEFYRGRLYYMPPCGDLQQDVCVSVIGALERWVRRHPQFVVGGNEAGMLLGRDVRAADVAVWRRDRLGPYRGGYRRVPPILAVEVAGQDEGEVELREKTAWYLARGVRLVWIVLPEARQVLVLWSGGERRLAAGQRLPARRELPGLCPPVSAFFGQLR